MSDNVAITAGSGTTIATDDVGGGVQVQRVKLTFGPDGTANDVDVASGKLLPVQLRNSGGTELALATDATLSSLAGGLTETAPGTDTASSGLNGRLQRVAQRLTTLITAIGTMVFGAGTAAGALRTTLASDDPAVAILGSTSGAKVVTDANGTVQQYLRGLISQWIAGTLTLAARSYSASVTLTRTADTNAYLANDVVGSATGSTAALTFTNMGPGVGDLQLTSVSLEIDSSAPISGETSYRLYLYNVTPPSALGDNAAFDLPSGDRASFLGYVDLGIPADLGSTLFVQTDNINKQIKLAGTSLFGYLVTIGAYTPTSARVHVITLHAVA